MWHINERFEPTVLDVLPSKGFHVSSTGGVMRVEKYGCAAELRRTGDGRYQMTILPTLLWHGQFTRLWDAGYQKFFVTDDRKKIPALASQLENMRRFNEELRSALGVPTYYNEALGSTCQLTAYDRVDGRPGEFAEETIGLRPKSGH